MTEPGTEIDELREINRSLVERNDELRAELREAKAEAIFEVRRMREAKDAGYESRLAQQAREIEALKEQLADAMRYVPTAAAKADLAMAWKARAIYAAGGPS